jgi:hypothetical protein
MADITEAIYSRLTGDATVAALVVDRVFPFTPKDPVTRPYITYHLISMLPRPHAMGSDPAMVTDRYQLDLWADSYEDMIALDDAVMARLSRWRGTEAGVVVQSSFHVDRRDSYEPDTKYRRRSNDFEISWEES